MWREEEGMDPGTLLKLAVLASISIAASAVRPVEANAQTSSPIARADTARLARTDRLFEQYDRNNAPGYAVGIIQDGRLVYARGFGIANLDYEARITPTTVFNVASLSKQFTAACVGILIQRGRLSLDDAVKQHI